MSHCVDYVIIGAGAAGCVLANLLSADRKTEVVLLEAGQNSDNDPNIVDSAVANSLEGNYSYKYFWQGNTIPMPSLNGRTLPWTNGRLLGGGTSINGEIYVRGSPQVYNDWEAIVGPDWSAEKIYSAFKDMESFVGPVTDPCNHGTNGPMAIRVGVSDSNSTPIFISALQNLGVPVIDDYNNPATPIGVFPNWQYFQFPDGTRASSSRTFLQEGKIIDEHGHGLHGRKLRVLTQATATRLIWSDDDKKIKGIIALHKGCPLTIAARKKVIVSAGFKSSQFLQVNGIGPADVLKAANIPVKIDNPSVGQYMKDYPYVPFTLLAPPNAVPNSDPNALTTAGAWLADPRPGSDPTRRAIELSGVFNPTDGLNLYILLLEAPLLPKSNGTIQVQDRDILKIEEANINMFSDPDDIALAVSGATTYILPLIQAYMAQGYYAIEPPISTLQDPVALEQYILNNAGNTHHYQHFNKMAPREQGGVVDNWGNVYGVKNLMVVDDSITPTSTDGNTAAPAEMLAWRIAKHLIAKDAAKCK